MIEPIMTELDSMKIIADYLIKYKDAIDPKKLTECLRNLEKIRYVILNKVTIINKSLEDKDDKVEIINNLYSAKLKDDILKIYIPETLPKYKNISNPAYKNILLNTAEAVKEYNGLFGDKMTFVLIIVHEKQSNMDIDNKFVKPIIDALVLQNIIHDDNINNMFYMALGQNDTKKAYTEVFVMDGKYMLDWINKLKNTV